MVVLACHGSGALTWLPGVAAVVLYQIGWLVRDGWHKRKSHRRQLAIIAAIAAERTAREFRDG